MDIVDYKTSVTMFHVAIALKLLHFLTISCQIALDELQIKSKLFLCVKSPQIDLAFNEVMLVKVFELMYFRTERKHTPTHSQTSGVRLQFSHRTIPEIYIRCKIYWPLNGN